MRNTLKRTFAPAVAPPLTALTNALAARSIKAQTPYDPDAWQSLLSEANLNDRFGNIPDGLRYGFIVDFPTISHLQSPPNSPSVNTYIDQLRDIVNKEISKGRYIGPYPIPTIYQAIGPFQSSPLSIIPKQGKPGKFRLVQNFSYPLNPTPPHSFPSVNSYIDAHNFPATWGKFSIVYLLASRLPPGSEVATRDVAEAYRTIPLHPSQWPAAVVRISSTHACIDTCTAFGATPSAGSYGHLADAATEIFRYLGIGPLDKWVDDHVFFRVKREYITHYNRTRNAWAEQISQHGGYQRSGSRTWFQGLPLQDDSFEEFNEACIHPIRDFTTSSSRSTHDAKFSYAICDIDQISQRLGIPWETSKDQPFSHTTIYIGFVWDLRECTVSLSKPKIDKYLNAITEWNQRVTHVLEDVQKLYGKLLHASCLTPAGRAYLTGFERMLPVSARKPFMPIRPEKTIAADLDWWTTLLSTNALRKPIHPPHTFIDLAAFSDASSGVGIGITIGPRWRAWRLQPGWQTLDGKRDIAWAEAIGFELLILSLATLIPPDSYLLLHGDNTSIIESWRVGRHRNKLINNVFQRIHEHLATPTFPIRSVIARFVPSADNPADKPSRGIYGPLECLLPPLTTPWDLREYIVDFDAPITPQECRALSEGRCALPAVQLLNRIRREQEVNERVRTDQEQLDELINNALDSTDF